MTPRPFKKVIQESKQGKPKVDWTYCTDRSGLNLQTGGKTERPLLALRSEDTNWLIHRLLLKQHLRFDHGPQCNLSFPFYKLVDEVRSHARCFEVQLKETVIVAQSPGSSESERMGHTGICLQGRGQVHQLSGQVWREGASGN